MGIGFDFLWVAKLVQTRVQERAAIVGYVVVVVVAVGAAVTMALI